MKGKKRRRHVEPPDDWKQRALLRGWPEQVSYEEIRLLALREALFRYPEAL